MAALRHLLIDRTGTLRPHIAVATALLVIGVALALASLGGRLALAGIAIVQIAVVAGLLWWGGRAGLP
jgi:hypothetical protein